MPCLEAIDAAKSSAIEQALETGAMRDTIDVVDVKDFPLSYRPGQAIRARVRVAGEAAA